MQQNKTIRIFLGSSITELHYERLHLADYLMNSVRPIFENDGIRVEVIKCEDIRSGNTGRSSQDEIDDKIKESDISVFIFKEKAGKDTIHEFDVTRKMQKTKHHEIYVYCFEIPKEERSDELIAFQQRLEKQKKNRLYWKTCKDITDLESQFVLGLLKYERQLLGMQPTIDMEQESISEKDGDALFAEYQDNEQTIQAPLREKIHQKIDDLLQQTKTVMENEDDTIAAKIIKVVELYKKADRWAAATAYDKEKYYNLLSAYARFLYDYGLYKDAETVYLRQILLAEELYGTEHKNTADSYNNISVVYDDQGDYVKALEYYQKALAIVEKNLGAEHPDTATSYNNIGSVYWKRGYQGDYDKALEYYQKALAIQEKVHGTEHPETATSYNNIGTVYYAQGDYDKALKYLLKTLEIQENAFGTEHPIVATDYNNIGAVYKEQGEYGKALKYYQKALAIQENALGTEHPLVATDYNNIGSMYYQMKEYPKALEYLGKALEIFGDKLGDEHPYTKGTFEWILHTLIEMGKNEDEIIEFFRNLFGK